MRTDGSSRRRDSIFTASIVNAGARAWEALINLATVPVLLAHLGTEAYGLVGFTQTIFGVIGLLDFGLSNAVSRELARGETDASGRRVIRPIVRSLELPLLGVALLLGLALVASAGFLARDFLRTETLSEPAATRALQWFAGIFVFRWIAGFYRGVFFGLERQVRYNLGAVAYATLRFAGGAGLLAGGFVGLAGLFAWYLATDLLFFLGLRGQVLIFEKAGEREGPGFSLDRLRAVLPYALGTMGIALVGVLVMQFDKLILARLRPLAELGAYSFAFALAMGIRIIPGAIWTATFPRLVQLEAADRARMREVLAGSFQASSIAALALAAPLVAFAPDIVETLGRRAEGMVLAAPLLALLSIGVFVESLVNPPHQQLLAGGHARILLRLAIEIGLAYAAAMAVAVAGFGAIGAALCWPVLQLLSLGRYTRRARQQGGPDLGGLVRDSLPAYGLVLAATLVVRLATLRLEPALATAVAGLTSGAILLLAAARIRARHPVLA